jgi:PLD-like domain
MMTQVVKPSWDLFDRLVAEAKRDLVICAPWVAAAGLQRLQHRLLNVPPGTPLPRVQIWARVADINTDSPGILELVRNLVAAGVSVVVRDSPLLHAKIYLADRALALVTSANLSEGGFSSNLEAAVVISEPEGIAQVIKLLASIEAETELVTASALDYFVTKQRPLLVEEAPPAVLPAMIPVWRRPAAAPIGLPVGLPGKPPAGELGQSRAIDLRDLIRFAEASIQAAQAEIQQLDLGNWVGRKARVWACPCNITQGPSPYLTHLSAPYFLGELQLGQRLAPERFTVIEGTVEKVLERGRALFRKHRAREARIELTRYPDCGSRNALNNTDSRFLLKIQAVD